jgi:hypothetical protein
MLLLEMLKRSGKRVFPGDPPQAHRSGVGRGTFQLLISETRGFLKRRWNPKFRLTE